MNQWTFGLVALGMAASLLLGIPGAESVEAQQVDGTGIFPGQVYFTPPVAASSEPRFILQLIQTDLFENFGDERVPFDDTELEDELHVVAGLGGMLPLWRFVAWEGGGMTLALQTGVFGRFRAEKATNDLVASDWIVGFPIDAQWNDFEARVRWYHWSAHLGDEFIETTGADRIDFTYEALDFLGAYHFGPARVYGGGAWIMRSQLEGDEPLPEDFQDRAAFQLGTDGYLPLWSDGLAGVVWGSGVEWEERTDWDGRLNLVVGLQRSGAGGTGRFTLNYGAGPSSVGQFFRSQESVWGFGFRIEF